MSRCGQRLSPGRMWTQPFPMECDPSFWPVLLRLSLCVRISDHAPFSGVQEHTPMPKSSAKKLLTFLTLVSFVRVQPASQAGDFKRDVIYQIVTHRFFDSDPTNNDPPQSSGLFDSTKTNFQAYWGGDLAGIQQKLP